MTRIAIVQPYVPSYRIAFFERVIAELKANGHECFVVSGTPTGDAAVRGDAKSPSWLKARTTHELSIAGKRLRWHSSWKSWRKADYYVVELSSTSIDSLVTLWCKPGRTITWGHVKSYTSHPNKLSETIKVWQMRRSRLTFAYTHGGAREAISKGLSPDKIVTLMNTIDLNELQQAVETARSISTDAVQLELDVPHPELTVSMIGSLDSSKRVKFVGDVLDELWKIDRKILLLVGGLGKDSWMLDAASKRGQVRMLGRVDSILKAKMSKVSQLLINPGRIGLIAPESFVLGLPILTTDWPFHAPENEYLEIGTDSLLLPNDPQKFAVTLRNQIHDESLTDLRMACRAKSGTPSLEHMVKAFSDGILDVVERRD
ncbi:glycosyltransferase [Paramicrobacterium fandaimingii]|uniref:glycosyltransferase n=1 Tax=Paramicrobacterium fandaimingii TaxID=2708079 RepID=UPI00141E3500|nr:glycosyltransferase [Microbacterium fandaimingii]